MPRRGLRRRTEKQRRQAPAPTTAATAQVIVREPSRVERLAYTSTQAADAIGISRSTFNPLVLPFVETVEMPSGTRLSRSASWSGSSMSDGGQQASDRGRQSLGAP